MDTVDFSKGLAYLGVAQHICQHNLITSLSQKSIIWFWLPWTFVVLFLAICVQRIRHQYRILAENGIRIDRGLSPAILILGQQPKYRFRKRDKIEFYRRKLIRQMTDDPHSRSIASNLGDISQIGAGLTMRRLSNRLKKQPWIATKKIARLFSKRKSVPTRALKRHSEAFLNFSEGPIILNPPPGWDKQTWLLVRNVRMFNNDPDAEHLYRDNTNVVNVAKGDYLFEPGAQDDSIYVVVKGILIVSIREEDNKEHEIKRVGPGENVFSLLSVLDVMANRPGIFKTVCARAEKDCEILRLQGHVFSELFDRKPETWLPTVRVIVMKLMHVTLTTLHNYMGLRGELFKLRLRESRKHHTSGTNKLGDRMQQHNQSNNPLPESSTGQPCDPSDPVITTCLHLNMGENSGHRTPRTCKSVSSTPQTSKKPLKEELQYWKRIGVNQLTELLALPPQTALTLDDRIEVRKYPPGYCLIEQGCTEGTMFYVLKGLLQVEQATADNDTHVSESFTVVAYIHSRESVGALSTISSEPSFFTVRAKHESWVVKITRTEFDKIVADHPRAILNVAHLIVERLSPFIRAIDFALDWELRDSGQALYIQDTPADSLYVALSGRLRSVMNAADGQKQMVEEFGRGDLIGLLDVLTRKPYTTDVVAIRHSELAKLPDGLISYIKVKFPGVMSRIVLLLSSLINNYHQKVSGPNVGDNLPAVRNLSTIAIVAADDKVPITAFSLELLHAMNAIKPALRLTYSVMKTTLGEEQADMHLRTVNWLNMQEEAFGAVIYQCDPTPTKWTERCLRQADCVLVVAMGDSGGQTHIGEVEQLLIRDPELGRAQKELVLLWKHNQRPRKTTEWLESRSFVSGHYHFRALNRMFKKKQIHSSAVEDFYERYVFQMPVDPLSDCSRLARVLTGTSVGLVLSGGGARGASHVGVINALCKAGVPIDSVAGVSIGSLIGGLYCDELDLSALTRRARSWFMQMKSTWKNLFDLSCYHHSSIFTGALFNKYLQNLFGRRQIEDLWIPFFCITTDISSSQMRVHRSGSLWKYCRASMSLAGYLPPLCDPQDGHHLLDGGYVNNLPADVMRATGARYVIAVDVGAEDEKDLTNYGESLSGLWVLWHKYWPYAEKIRVLNMEEIQSRLAYVSCVRQMEQVKKAPYCLYMRPPIDKVHTLEFGKFDEVNELGLVHARPLVEEWVSTAGKLLDVVNPEKAKQCHSSHMQHMNVNTHLNAPAPMTRTNTHNNMIRSPTSNVLNDLTASLVAATKQPTQDTDTEQSAEEDDYEQSTTDEELYNPTSFGGAQNMLDSLASPGRVPSRKPSPVPSTNLLNSLSHTTNTSSRSPAISTSEGQSDEEREL